MSEAFRPSPEAARAALGASANIVTKDHPGGKEGATISLKDVARRIEQGRKDPRVQGWAGRALIAAGRPKSQKAQAQAILDAFHKQTMYVKDPDGVELIKAAKTTLCLDEHGLCMPAGDCFPKGTLLLRDDYEIVPIDEIKVGDRIWGYDKWTRVEAKVFKGILAVDAIFMNNGSTVQLTGDHFVGVLRCPEHNHYEGKYGCSCTIDKRKLEKIRVKDLKSGDVLKHPDRIDFGSIEIDPDVAYIEGLFVADGWADRTKKEFSISGKDGCPKEAQKLEVKKICDRLGITTRWQRKSIAVRDPVWALRMQEMGHRAPNKHLLSINFGEAAAAQTLRGVMADSGGHKNGAGRTFTTTSHRLAVQTRILHRMFGLSCGSSYIEDHGGLGENPIWRLHVRQRERVDGKGPKLLRAKDIARKIRKVPCYDIQTEDHYVYLAEHDVTVFNCDDLATALGSALSSVAIPVKVIGQAFGTDLPTHVMIGVETEEGFKKIDPSTDTMKVGNYHMATKEWTLDPLDHAKFMLAGATGGEYIGIGAPGTLGELTDDQKKVLYDTMTFQLQTAVWTLERAVNGLGTALNEIATVRRETRPDNLFDPEPSFAITSLADFPSSGIWTERMNTIATSLWATGDRLVKAGREALDGGRTIFVDKVSGDAFIQALTTDPWYLRTIVQKVTDSVIAIYDKGGQIIGGFLSSNGKKLTPAEVQQEMQPGVQGLGAIQAIGPAIVIGTAAMVAIASIGTYFTVAKLCDAAKTYAREATRQDLAKCVTSGKCSQKVFDDVAKQRQQEAENDAKNDPFSKAADKLTNVLTLLAISGAVIGGVVVLAPLARTAAESFSYRRRI